MAWGWMMTIAIGGWVVAGVLAVALVCLWLHGDEYNQIED